MRPSLQSYQVVSMRRSGALRNTFMSLWIVALLLAAQQCRIAEAMPVHETTTRTIPLQSSAPPSVAPSAAPSPTQNSSKTVAPTLSPHSNSTVAPNQPNNNVTTKAPTAVPVSPNVTTKAPSVVPPPPSLPSMTPSAAPSTQQHHKNNTSPSSAPSQMPSHAPSRRPSVAPTTTPRTTTPPTRAPSVPPPPPHALPTAAPSSSDDDSHSRNKLSIWKILGKTIAWFILLMLGVLLFGACMSNRYRIYYFLRGVWYTVLQLQCTNQVLQWFARVFNRNTSSSSSSVDASLNTILFDNEMSEGLLMRETNE